MSVPGAVERTRIVARAVDAQNGIGWADSSNGLELAQATLELARVVVELAQRVAQLEAELEAERTP